MGFWTRAGSECCLIATKGKPKLFQRNVRSVFSAKAVVHSKKPDLARTKIVSLCGDVPRIELFARNTSKNWDVWGDQVSSSIIL